MDRSLAFTLALTINDRDTGLTKEAAKQAYTPVLDYPLGALARLRCSVFGSRYDPAAANPLTVVTTWKEISHGEVVMIMGSTLSPVRGIDSNHYFIVLHEDGLWLIEAFYIRPLSDYETESENKALENNTMIPWG